jgi:large subunit ribosomal protein L21
MYAIIDDGGRQYKVSDGDTIVIDRPESETTAITFDRVLLVGGLDGGPRVGAPTVAGAKVSAEVVGPAKAPKIDIFKYKRRKGYHKRQGHRQHSLAVRITSITV